MKKLLYIATRQFWPTSTGHETVMYYYCKGLFEEYGYDIYLFCFADKTVDKKKIKPAFIKDVVYVDVPGKMSAIKNAMRHSFFGNNRWPLQNDLYYSNPIQEKLKDYYYAIKPDALFVDMIRLVPYVYQFKHEPIKKILIAEDNLAKRYKRQIENSDFGNTTGYYSNNLSGIINKLTSLKKVKNLILKMEISRLEKYEGSFLDEFDYITFISPIEVEEYNNKYKTKKAIKLTMGADIQYFSQDVVCGSQEDALVFVGNYTYAPNADSIKWICTEIMPKLDKSIKLYVIGNCPDDLRKQIESNRVIVMGFVDDIRIAVKKAKGYLSPITYGTGIKTKIIEAMAMGMPVVTNSVGAESLDVQSGIELFIEDDVDSIVERVNELLQDEHLRTEMGNKGKTFVMENHSWEKVYETFGKMGL